MCTLRSEDVIAAYIADTLTLHWLWRLQGDEEQNFDGVTFDLLNIGNSTVKVYCKTLQQYESGWLALCWLIFGVRLALTFLFDGLLVMTTIRCEASSDSATSALEMSSDEFKRLDTNQDGALTNQEFEGQEVAFFECMSSVWLWVLLAAFFLLDFGSLLNPILNPTAVQQGA